MIEHKIEYADFCISENELVIKNFHKYLKTHIESPFNITVNYHELFHGIREGSASITKSSKTIRLGIKNSFFYVRCDTITDELPRHWYLDGKRLYIDLGEIENIIDEINNLNVWLSNSLSKFYYNIVNADNITNERNIKIINAKDSLLDYGVRECQQQSVFNKIKTWFSDRWGN